MTLYPLILLVLTACVHSWQLSFDNDVLSRDSEPPYTHPNEREVKQLPVDEDLDMSAATLPVSSTLSEKKDNTRRQLPVDEDIDMSAVTLPVPPRRRVRTGAGAERVKTRQLPEEEIDSLGVLTLPVVHSTKPSVWKRAVEVDLAKRSDVAYYAQREHPSAIHHNSVSDTTSKSRDTPSTRIRPIGHRLLRALG